MNNKLILKTIPSARLIFIMNISFMVLFCSFAFKHNITYLFCSFDGSYMLDIIRQQSRWDLSNTFGYTNNLFQSLGNVYFPLNTSLIPGYWFARIINNDIINKVVPYVVISTEIFLAICIFSINFKFKPYCGIIAGWVFLIFAMPLFGNPLSYELLCLVPHFCSGMAESLILMVLFSRFAGSKGILLVALATISVLIIAHMILAYPGTVMLVMPILAVAALSSFLSITNQQGAKRYIITMLFIITFLLLTGFAHYFLGLFDYTAARFYPHELLVSRSDWYNVSILFHSKAGHIGAYLFALGMLGAILDYFTCKGFRKNFAAGFLSLAIIILLSGYIIVHFYPSWQGPVPLYYEIMIWPLYAIYTVNLLLTAAEFLIIKYSIKLNAKHFIWLQLGLLLPIYILLGYVFTLKADSATKSYSTYQYPPQRTAIIDILCDNISLRNNAVFNGRVASFIGQKLSQASWYDLYRIDTQQVYDIGNDHRLNGFIYFDIPTFFEYSPLITPSFYKLTKELLSYPQDSQLRNVMTLRKTDDKVLKMLGVRYFITDTPVSTTAKLRLHDDSQGYLYELYNVNVGQYSPVKTILSKDAKETINILSGADFNPQESVVIHKNIDKDLVAAKEVTMQFLHGGYIKLSAKTTGNSLLVLPLEYSNCLELYRFHSDNAKLFRVNLLQTAVLFNGDLDIKLRYFIGPMHNAQCRLKDKADVKALGL